MKIKKIFFYISPVVFFTVFCWVSSCRHDTILPANIPVVCFEKQVLPIFWNNCTIKNCHNGTGESRGFSGYNEIFSGVVPGKPNASPLYQAIITKWGENKMPPDGPLSIENRTLIRVWIEQGANHTLCTDSGIIVLDKPGVYPKNRNQLK